jgi:hypothetical protein
MLSNTRLIVAMVVIVLMTGCAAMPDETRAPEADFTLDMAKSALERITGGVAEHGVGDFCSRHVRSTGTCALLIKDALAGCLLPGDKPHITRVAHIPPKDRSEGGWLLEVRGRTQDGQRYVSEFFVVRPENTPPQAAFGIYWTGLGLEGSPFGPDNTRIPQNACPGKTRSSSG